MINIDNEKGEQGTSEASFINEFVPQEKEVAEYFRRITLKNYCIASFAICASYVLISVAFGYWIYAVIVTIIMAIITSITSIARFRQTYRIIQVQYSISLDDPISSFHADYIKTGGATLAYSQVTKVVITKSCIFLIIEKALTVMLKKDAFTKGDYEAFIEFLKEKLKDNPKALKGLRKA
jgi:large-conductance mechanosensitive channel